MKNLLLAFLLCFVAVSVVPAQSGGVITASPVINSFSDAPSQINCNSFVATESIAYIRQYNTQGTQELFPSHLVSTDFTGNTTLYPVSNEGTVSIFPALSITPVDIPDYSTGFNSISQPLFTGMTWPGLIDPGW